MYYKRFKELKLLHLYTTHILVSLLLFILGGSWLYLQNMPLLCVIYLILIPSNLYIHWHINMGAYEVRSQVKIHNLTDEQIAKNMGGYMMMSCIDNQIYRKLKTIRLIINLLFIIVTLVTYLSK